MRTSRKSSTPSKKRSRSDLEEDLLDVVLSKEDYRSSEDEDYAPSGPSGSRAPPRRVGRAQAGPTKAGAACAAAAVEPDEEMTPLAERRRQLRQQAQRGRPSPPAGAPPNSAHLPIEVISRVLQFAAAANAVPTVARAACVSCTWRAAVQQAPQLWRSLDLSSPRCRPTDAVVQRAAAGGRWRELLYLSLSGCSKLGDAALKALAQHCPKLSHLDLSYCTSFSESGLTSALSIMLLRRATAEASPLRCLNLSCIQVKPRASGIDQLLRQVLMQQAKNEDGPVLEELQMEGVPLLTHQGMRAICDVSFEQRRPLLGGLRLLSLTQSAGARCNFTINIERLQYASPTLEELRLNGLGGDWGWEFNQGAPAALPDYLPPAGAAGGSAASAAAAAAAGGGALGAAGRDSVAAVGAQGQQQQLQVEAPEGPGGGGGVPASRGATRAVGFPALRVAELGSIVLHAEGSLFGRSHLTDAALERLIGSATRLEELDLRGTTISPDSLAHSLHSSAPLRCLALARSTACCDGCVSWIAERHRCTLEAVDLSWGGPHITDTSAEALAPCPRLAALNLAGTAVTEAGVRAVVVAAVRRGAVGVLALDISSCRGVGRAVRQAGSQGSAQLARALGLL